MEQPINWTTIIVAAIAGLPATIAAISALIVAIRTLRVSKETKAEVKEVHKSTNGRMGQLIEASKDQGELTAIKRQITAEHNLFADLKKRRSSDREEMLAAAASAAVAEVKRQTADDPTPQTPATRSKPD